MVVLGLFGVGRSKLVTLPDTPHPYTNTNARPPPSLSPIHKVDLATEEKLLDDLRANAKERTLRDKLAQDKREKAAVRI